MAACVIVACFVVAASLFVGRANALEPAATEGHDAPEPPALGLGPVAVSEAAGGAQDGFDSQEGGCQLGCFAQDDAGGTASDDVESDAEASELVAVLRDNGDLFIFMKAKKVAGNPQPSTDNGDAAGEAVSGGSSENGSSGWFAGGPYGDSGDSSSSQTGDSGSGSEGASEAGGQSPESGVPANNANGAGAGAGDSQSPSGQGGAGSGNVDGANGSDGAVDGNGSENPVGSWHWGSGASENAGDQCGNGGNGGSDGSAGSGNASGSGAPEGPGTDSGAGSGSGSGAGIGPGSGSGESGEATELADFASYYSLGDGAFDDECAPWYEKRGMIRNVAFGVGVKPKSMACWFNGLDKLENVDFNNLSTEHVESMGGMFSNCSSLVSLDLGSFDTSSVISMQNMFSGCSGLASLDLSSFDTCKVTDMRGMFSGNKSLKHVDLSSFDTSHVVDMCDMFSGCSSVESLDLSSFDTCSLASNDGMFAGCTSLASLDVVGFTADQLKTASIPTDNPGGFWRLNVPEGYDAGIELREPTAAERAAAGLIDDLAVEGGNGDNGGNGGGASSFSGTTNAGAATTGNASGVVNAGSQAAHQASDAPSSTTVSTLISDSGKASSASERLASQENAGIVAGSFPSGSSATVDSAGSGLAATASEHAMQAGGPTSGNVVGVLDGNAGIDDPGGGGAVGAGAAVVPAAPAAELAFDVTGEFVGEVIEDLLTPAAGNVASAVVAFAKGLAVQGAEHVSSLRSNLSDVAGVADSALSAMGIGAPVDKTAAMAIAAFGMLMAASLILTFCLKLR